MQWPPMIAYNKGMININADDLFRAQSTNGVLMTIKSWINEYSGEVDDKNINGGSRIYQAAESRKDEVKLQITAGSLTYIGDK